MFSKKKTNVPYLFTVQRKGRGRRGNREFNPKPFLYAASALIVLTLVVFALPHVYANPFKKVTVVDGYGEYTLLTSAKTVGEIYARGSLNLKENDSTLSLDTPVTDSMAINVDRSIVVNVISGGTNVRVRTKSGTAREVLLQSGISFKETDQFNVGLDANVKNGDTLVHAKIETKTVTKKVSIDYDTVTVEDKSLAKGKSDVIFSGEDGYKNVSYLVTYKDGAEISRVVANEKVVKQPVSRKVAIGTKEETVVASAGSGGNNSSSSSSPSSGSSSSSSYNKPTKPINIVESPKDLDPKRIARTKVMNVTAYTHTGNATASGAMPSYGTVAVRTSEIPMGTKLYIPGYGIGIAQDTGSLASNTIDVFMDTHEDCISWGRKSLTIYILKY